MLSLIALSLTSLHLSTDRSQPHVHTLASRSREHLPIRASYFERLISILTGQHNDVVLCAGCIRLKDACMLWLKARGSAHGLARRVIRAAIVSSNALDSQLSSVDSFRLLISLLNRLV